MKIGVVSCALLAAGCATNPTDNTAAVDRACSVADCFTERDVRDIEVIDRTTLIVYTGPQHCAFKVELRGTFCDLTFAPELYFSKPGEISTDPNQRISRDDPFGRVAGDQRNLRICSNDIQIDVSGGVFTESSLGTSGAPTDRFGNRRSDCQVSSVASLTDDQVVELYVTRGVAPPPPPMGSGEIEVGEQQAEEPKAPTPPEPTANAAPRAAPITVSSN
jgi:hypothetical protein